MRLWSIDPDQLDRAALVAGWREGLLAQKVLRGLTKGYRNHPQLDRFRALPDPVLAVACWLHGLADAADRRGYRFDRTRVVLPPERLLADDRPRIELTGGQLDYEWQHLRAKVRERDPGWWPQVESAAPRPHPMMDVVPGPIAEWERP